MEHLDLTTEELIKRVNELEALGKKRKTLPYMRLVISRIPDAELFCQYGDLALDVGEWVEAEDAYLSAIKLSPEWDGPYVALGILYRERNDDGDLALACTYLETALGLQKTHYTYTLLGVVQDRLGRRREARDSYNESLKIDPNQEETWYNLGVTYRDENNAKAIEFFRKTLELDPEYQAAYRELGWALKRAKQYKEAEIHLRKSIELNDQDGWAYLYLGNLYWAKQNLPSAEEYFKKAIAIWPDDSVPYRCLAHLYECHDRVSEADFFYEKATQLDPDEPTANLRFGLFLKEVGENQKAKAHLQRVLISDPNDIRVINALAELEELGETESKQKAN